MAGSIGNYNAAILADSPVVYWKLSDTNASVLTDSSGNGRHGIYLGTPTYGVTGLLAEDPTYSETSTTFNGTALGRYGVLGAGVPFVYWKMNDTSGNVIDYSGNARHIGSSGGDSITGPVQRGTAGIATTDSTTGETSFTFGSGGISPQSYLIKGSLTAPWSFSKFSADAWFNWSGTHVGPYAVSRIIGRGNPTALASVNGWGLDILSGQLWGQVEVSGGTGYVGPVTISANTNYRATLTYDGIALRLYLNGTQRAASTINAPMASVGVEIYIGGYYYAINPRQYVGRIEKIALFNQALTAEQVATGDWSATTGNAPFTNWVNMPVISVEALVKPVTIAAGPQIICERDANGPRGTAGRIWNMLLADGYPSWSLQTTLTDYVNVQGPTKLSAGTLYHMVGTYDGTTAKLYVNAQLVAAKDLPGQLIQPYIQNLTVGNSDDQSLPFKGTLEKIAIYNKALTAEQIQTHYAAISATTITPTMASSVGSVTGSNGSSFFVGNH